jgi:hypothetical protein
MATKLKSFQNGIVRLFEKTALLLLSSLFCPTASFSQLTVDENVSAQQLVNSIVEPGYAVSNAKYNCPVKALAAFKGTSDIGFEKGILLTNGLAANAIGPNNSNGKAYNNGTAGDPQLDTLLGTETLDGCALEFDFVPACDTFKIKYVFASEEYPEYVNKAFNDAFAIFISGPGVPSNRNIACVPSTNTPVSINTINAGVNNIYYVNNAGGTTVQYDGFTKPLIASYPVIPCSVYHLKIVIADITDGIYDSGLFIEDGSVRSSPTGKSVGRCGAGVVNLSATAASGTLNWYSEKTGGNLVHTGTDYSVNLTTTTTFYVENVQSTCTSPRTPVTGSIYPEVPKPSITESGGVLSAPAGYSYQWYFNGVMITGAIHQTYTPVKTGNYLVVISTDKNCSAASDVFSITVGIHSMSLNASTQVYPSPANEMMYIETPANGNATITISIYSAIGKLMHQETYLNSNQPHEMNTGFIPASGIYFMKLQSENETIIRKIQINR